MAVKKTAAKKTTKAAAPVPSTPEVNEAAQVNDVQQAPTGVGTPCHYCDNTGLINAGLDICPSCKGTGIVKEPKFKK